MKNVFYLLIALIFSSNFYSQTQSIAFPTVGKGVATAFVTDYHCLGINVSGLGWGSGVPNKRFTVGASEFGFGIFSDSLNSDKLRSLSKTIYQQATRKGDQPIDYQKQREAAANYAEAGISIFADFNWGGFSFQSEKFGGIAFNVRENYQWYSKLNQQTSDILFRGKLSTYFDSLTVVFGSDTSKIANSPNLSQDTLAAVIQGNISVPLSLSQITKGTEIRMVWNRSYNFGYGRKIIGKDSLFILYGGIGGRIISSIALFNLQSDENGLRAYSAISPAFNIDYGNVSGANVAEYKGKGIPPAVGSGYGIDLSLSALLFKKLRVAASVNNIGSVTYKRNVYTVKDTLFGDFSLSGLDNSSITNSVNQLLKEGGILRLEGEEKFKLVNASDFELNQFIRFGFDFVAPFDKENPGSIQNAIVSFGGDFHPLKWLQLSAGYYGGGIYKNNIPLGVTFILKDGTYECGIASRDALSFFTKNAHSVSTAFGFARFRF